MKIEKRNGKYTCRLSYYDASGNRHQKRFSGDSKQQVRAMIVEYENRMRVYMESLAFGDSMKRYIDTKEPVLSASTIKGYRIMEREMHKNYERFCGISCDRITSDNVQAVITDLKDRGRKPKTIANYVGLINSVIKHETGSAPQSTVPKRIRKPFLMPTEEDMKKILELCKGTRLEVPISLAVLGLRRGEICSLELSDLNGSTLHIHRSKVYTDDYTLVTNERPKTDPSDRFIRVPDDLADLIRKKGVICDFTPDGLTEAFRHLLDKNELPHYVLHSCRHFYVSYCHAHGVPDADILATGGWASDYVMKRIYREAMNENAASAAIGGFLGG